MKGAVFLETLRPGQWTKNLLVFACGFFALADRNQTVDPVDVAARALAAFSAFCLASGAVYIVNDIHDRALDAMHPVKRTRPVASGRLSPRAAAVECGVVLALAFAVSAPLGGAFTAAVAAYFALQIAYTFRLKRIAFVDAAAIAAGFSLRVVAGALACAVALYPWIVGCSFTLALFLALGKRRAELEELGAEDAGRHRAALGGYTKKSLDVWCCVAALSSLLGYSAWTFAPSTISKFGTRGAAATIPFVAFAAGRYLWLVLTGQGGARPETEFRRHPEILAAIALWIAACVAVFKASAG